ncbi:TPA: hypothetical protein ACJW8I_000812, partial [Streptococcus pneumoniae]
NLLPPPVLSLLLIPAEAFSFSSSLVVSEPQRGNVKSQFPICLAKTVGRNKLDAIVTTQKRNIFFFFS